MCSADGKIRLATLELSCLLLKQQVVTSTGCIIKDVHLACLEVRAPHPVGPEGEWEEVGEAEAAGSCPEPRPWCPQHPRPEAGPEPWRLRQPVPTASPPLGLA